MKISNVSLMFSRLIVFSLTISLLGVHTMAALTVPAKGMATAEVTVSGRRDGGERPFVLVNGERAFSGRTFFSNGTVSTTETSSATVSLGKLGRIDVAPSSSLSLSFSEGRIAGTLSRGIVTVSNTEGVWVTIDTPGDSVSNDGKLSSRFTVTAMGDQTGIAVMNGTVHSRNGSAIAKKDDDDDDDDHDRAAWWIWGTVALVAGAVVLVVLLNDDEDDTVSPVR